MDPLTSVLLVGVAGQGPAGASAAQEGPAQRVHVDLDSEEPALVESGEEGDDGQRMAHLGWELSDPERSGRNVGSGGRRSSRSSCESLPVASWWPPSAQQTPVQLLPSCPARTPPALTQSN